MRNFESFNDNGTSLLEPRTILSVKQILENFFRTGEIPAAMNNRPYDFESEIGADGFAHAKGFEGDFSRVLHPDLFQTVSRESRESAGRKAALSGSAGSGLNVETPGAAASVAAAPSVSSTEGAQA